MQLSTIEKKVKKTYQVNTLSVKVYNFLKQKDRPPDNFIDNREHLIAITRATDTVIANTFFQKNSENKITYKAMATESGPPWTPERYYEIDHCLVRKCWRNSVIDITTDPHTNINTDRYMMTVEIKHTKNKKRYTI